MDLHTGKILLITGDALVITLAQKGLKTRHVDGYHFELLVAPSLASGLEVLSKEAIRLILLDEKNIDDPNSAELSTLLKTHSEKPVFLLTKDQQNSPLKKAGSMEHLLKGEHLEHSLLCSIQTLLFEREIKRLRNQYEENVSQIRNQFLKGMSSQLRPAITGMLGTTDLLLDTNLSPSQRRYTQTIRNTGEILIKTVTNLIEFSKLKSAHRAPIRIAFKFRNTVEETIEVLAQNTYKKELVITNIIDPNIPTFVSGDPTKVRQVLFNLASNAMKFTQEGAVLIRSTISEESDREMKIRFEIIDTGVGIDPRGKKLLSDFFSQSEPKGQKPPKEIGLGLIMAKRLINMMGGTIGVKSKESEGSIFWFTVPVAISAAHSVLRARSNLETIRALVISENPWMCDFLAEQLRLRGIDSKVFSDGRKALVELAAQQQDETADIVICDSHIDGINVTDFLRRLKDDPRLAHLPVLSLVSIKSRRSKKELSNQIIAKKPLCQSDLYRYLADLLAVDNTEADPLAHVSNF